MNQERILELIAETAALTLSTKKKAQKEEEKEANVTLDLTMSVPSKQNESILSTKNDPDVIKIARCKFDINKTYIEVVGKHLESKGDKEDVVIRNDEANYFITRGSLERLKPGKWLNDEILNAYIKLINMRKGPFKGGFALNTFFYTMLENMAINKNYTYEKLNRVLKKQKVDNLASYSLIMIPVNIRHSHWLLLVLDTSNYHISVVDSMCPASSGECDLYLATLSPFLRDHFSSDPWTISPVVNVPL